MKLFFTKYPVTTGNLIFLIESEENINEMGKLYSTPNKSLIDGGYVLSIPRQEELENVQIKSVELKDLFKKFEGEKLFLLQSIDNYSIDRTPIEIDFSKLKESQNSD